MNIPKHLFEFVGTVTLKEKDKEPVQVRETFYAIAETSEKAHARLAEANPKVPDLTYTGNSKPCNRFW